ncbi:NAD(P)-binding protein [Meredithblackwellia eburnea MCA 4105]
MSSFTKFAVVGAGGLGAKVVSALVSKGAQVTVLARKESKTAVPEGATLKHVDYTDSASIESALSGAEVVISTLGGAAMATQPAVIKAASKASAKLFVPSEFGNPSVHLTSGPLYDKTEAAALLKSLGLPSLRVFTGPFPDFCLVPFLGFDFKGGKAAWVGEGNTPIGFTHRDDVASFLAYTLTTLPPAELSDRIFRIEGDRKSFNEIVSIYEGLNPGSKVEVTRTPVEAAAKVAETDKGFAGLLSYLLLSWENGASPYADGPLDNKLYADWKPVSIKDLLASL